MQAKQSAWVFGATGLTGRGVVRALCLANINCHAHLRPNSSSRDSMETLFSELGAFVEPFDWTETQLKAAFEKAHPTVVFLTLGTTNARAKLDGQGHRAVDYRLTKMVLDVLKAEYPEAQVVYLSAVRSLGASLSDYFKIRVELEAELKTFDTHVLVAQPALITGDRIDARPWEHRAAVATNRGLDCLSAIGWTGMARRYRSLDGTTLARGMVQLWLEQSTCGIADVGALASAAVRFGDGLIDA
jgi:hypothetical protein